MGGTHGDGQSGGGGGGGGSSYVIVGATQIKETKPNPKDRGVNGFVKIISVDP